MAEVLVFIVAAVCMIGGALGVVFSPKPVHSALFLILTFVGVALLFIDLEAHFLAAVQLIVYAGAIVILFLFVINLLGVDSDEDLGIEPINGQRPVAVVISAATLGLLVVITAIATDVLSGTAAQSTIEESLDNGLTDIERIGRVLFSDYVLAFEVTAALLTIAVIGAVVLTRTVRRADMYDDLEPASFEVAPAAPFGGNDSDLGDEAGHASADADVEEDA